MRNIALSPLRLFFDRVYNPVYKKRLAEIVASLCEENSYILDFGCSDGCTAKMIMELKPSLNIVGVDIQCNGTAQIPRTIYDGKKIPYPDNTFDIVLSLDVLHHTEEMASLIEEMKRVSRKYIIIKDHMVYSTYSRWLVGLSDFVSNVPYGINCAFNFPTPEQWNEMFSKLNLTIIEQPEKHDFGFGIDQKYNPVFKLAKIV